MDVNTADLGAVCFGLVVGWITYRTLVRRTDEASLSDIASVIGAVGGGIVVGLFKDQHLFGLYAFGLMIGFFAYLIVFALVNGRDQAGKVMGGNDGMVRNRDQ
jgi:uncharacterized membrane protein YfcA